MHPHSITVFLAALLLGSAQVRAETAGPLAVELVASGNLIPIEVQYRPTAAGIEVSGRIAKQVERSGRILGHVAITLVDAQGHSLGEIETALQGFSPSRKNPDWAGFHTRIEPLPAEVRGLRIRHELGNAD